MCENVATDSDPSEYDSIRYVVFNYTKYDNIR